MHTTDLPEGYRLVHSIDLQKNKKSALLVNIGGLAIAAAMIVPAAFFAPISDLFSLEGPPYAFLIRAAGDLYVFMILRKFPKDLLVRDSGVAMELFAKGNQDRSGASAAGQGSEAGE